jgi:hypothetical protein
VGQVGRYPTGSAGALVDRMSPALVFGVGLLAFATVYTGLGATRSHLAAWLLIAGYGGFTAGLWAGLAWGHDGAVPLVVSGVTSAVLAVGILAYTVFRTRCGDVLWSRRP